MQIILSDNCLPDVLDNLQWINLEPGATCYPWDVTPLQYLEFAETDIANHDSRSLINCIGNAKRAIHSHVDFLLHNCGRCLQSMNFPKKLDLLEQLGVIGKTILSKYNSLRNILEHEYAAPSSEDAEEVLDVAKLFIHATRNYTRPLPRTLMFKSTDGEQSCVVNCDWDVQQIYLVITPSEDFKHSAAMITPGSNKTVWVAWVARILKLMQVAEDPYVRCAEQSRFDCLPCS